MSLEGTLQTIALPDVLGLLSVTAKTGELRVESGGGVGSIWFQGGQVAGFDVGSAKTPVDALFGLLRLEEGRFRFLTGTEPANATAPTEVGQVLEEAQARLSKWDAICAVVPSLDARVSLRPRVEAAVVLSPEQWAVVAAVGAGSSVAEVLAAVDMSEFEGSRVVRDLADLDLVEVVAGSTAPVTANLRRAPADGPEPAAEAPAEPVQSGQLRVPDLSGVWEDDEVSDELSPEEATVGAEADEATPASAEPVNRGLLLRFLGAARN